MATLPETITGTLVKAKNFFLNMVNNNLHPHLAITRYIIGDSWRWHEANYELLNALNSLTTESAVNDITNGAYSSE